MARQRVENTKFIDIQSVLGLDLGHWYKFKLDCTHDRHYVIKKSDHCVIDSIKVDFATTKTGYGNRYWFKCPCCGRNAKRLYIPGKSDCAACRTCHKLTYTKSQLSGNEFEYLSAQIRELQGELKVTKENGYPLLDWSDALIQYVPMFKPKYMRQSKFDMKRVQLELMILRRSQLWCAMAGRGFTTH